MKKFRCPYFPVFCLMALCLSCVDEVQLEPRSVESRLVVEGLLTDENRPYSVKLTYTGEYNSLLYGQQEIPVSTAAVSVTEIGGNTTELSQSPISPGVYWTHDADFVGKPGAQYQLRIKLADGRVFVSYPEELRKVADIQRLYAEYRPRAETDLTGPDHYEVLLDTQDPVDEGDFYRWSGYGYVPRRSTGEALGRSLCCYWCWVPSYAPVTEVLSDAFVNGSLISRKPVLSSPVYYAGRHYIEIRQYSLTQQAYQFWVRFEEQRKRNGSLFDPLPASIEGNVHLENNPDIIALGYFGCSAVKTKRLVIPGDTLSVPKLEIKYGNDFVEEGNCTRVYPQGQLTPPQVW